MKTTTIVTRRRQQQQQQRPNNIDDYDNATIPTIKTRDDCDNNSNNAMIAATK
jgi:hypothetical protein